MYTAKISIPMNAITERIFPSTKRRWWRLIFCCTLRWKSRWKSADGSAALLHCSRHASSSRSSTISSLRSCSLSQRILQHVPCAVQTYCHIVFRDAQHFRHLCVRQAFQHEHDHLPVSHRKRLNGRHQPRALVRSRRLLFRMRPRINWLGRLFDLLQRLSRRPSLPYMTKPTIVSDAVHERSLRALASKMRQRLPYSQRDVLHQLFSHARHRLIAKRQPRDGRAVLTENAIELRFQFVAPLAHDCDPTGKSIFG